MPKPKLTDALNPKTAATTASSDVSTTTSQIDADTSGETESSSESDDDEPDSSQSDDEPATKSLADFQAEFGRELGAVYFAEGTSFETASAIKSATDALNTEHAKVIEAKDAEIANLQSHLAAAGKEILGEADPVITGSEQTDSPGLKARAVRMGSEGKARYAEALEKKMAAK